MLHTNLLPEEEKRAIILEKSFRIIKFFGITIIGTFIIGIALLAPSYLPLYFQNNEFKNSLLVQQEAAAKIDYGKIVSDALQIQATISSLRQTADNSSAALDIFDLLAAQQTGIIVSEFTIDKNASITIIGNAATRNDLLAFEQYLRDSSRLRDLASPLANIIKEANINFNLRGTVKQN